LRFANCVALIEKRLEAKDAKVRDGRDGFSRVVLYSPSRPLRTFATFASNLSSVTGNPKEKVAPSARAKDGRDHSGLGE
jgi:hypothetical protein